MSIDSSLFKRYSIGYVAKDKTHGSVHIRAFPIERIPFFDGSISPDTKIIYSSGIDRFGNPYYAKVKSDHTIRCEWLRGDNFSCVPADVVAGEYIDIYRYMDTDKFYWKTIKNNHNLRTTDSFTIAIAAKADGDKSGSDITQQNAYVISGNSADGFLNISTSQNRGEKYGYCFQINTKDSTVYTVDTDGNKIGIASLLTLVEMVNKEKTRVALDKTNCFIHAENQIKLTGSENITLETKHLVIKASDNFRINSPDISIDGGTFVYKGNTFTSNCANNVFNGSVTMGGSGKGKAGDTATFNSSVTFRKRVSFSSGFDCDGNAVFSQPISAPNVR